MTGATWGFDAIGTRWRIDTAEPLAAPLRRRVARVIEEYDRAFSRFRTDSLVRRHAATGGTLEYPEAASSLFALYRRVEQATGGSVTPLIGASLERLGYDADYSLRPSGDPIPAPAAGLLASGATVTLAEPALIDVGAAGKGQLVDLVAGELARADVRATTVDAGGDLRHDGDGILVALEHPQDPALAIGVVEVGGPRRAIAGSATNRRAWGNGWHHVLDATTGRPVREVVATWAVTYDAMSADLLATALFFVPGDRLAQQFELDWVRVLADGCVEHSATLPGEVFT